MAQGDLLPQGYPRSPLKKDWSYSLYCGGSGGGGISLQTQTKAKWAININPFIIKNTEMVFRNTLVDIYSDSGGLNILPWYLAVSPSSLLTDAQIIAQGNRINARAPFDIDLIRAKLPQPTDSNWQVGTLFVYIYWGSTAYYGDSVYTDNFAWLSLQRHNYEQRL